MNSTENTEILYPYELGEEYYQADTLAPAVHEPQFVGFQCLACDGRHDSLIELVGCAELKRTHLLDAPVVPVEVFA